MVLRQPRKLGGVPIYRTMGEQGGSDFCWVGGVGNKSIDFGCQVQFLNPFRFFEGKTWENSTLFMDHP